MLNATFWSIFKHCGKCVCCAIIPLAKGPTHPFEWLWQRLRNRVTNREFEPRNPFLFVFVIFHLSGFAFQNSIETLTTFFCLQIFWGQKNFVKSTGLLKYFGDFWRPIFSIFFYYWEVLSANLKRMTTLRKNWKN